MFGLKHRLMGFLEYRLTCYCYHMDM